MVDTDTKAPVDGHPVIAGCAGFDAALTPDGRHAFVTSSVLGEPGEVWVFDTAVRKARRVLMDEAA
ncbi:hypothetical protein OG429_03830 [Streptomyces sp. NBC_00190]|uniref:hypothetical protein n=1 Tax=unclassified Streptomyces TaxID=2593676 RepID=UPI002E2E5403|nr:hypothetical protein [Streptomyces sp. NBC_00190]WSZ38527.1 hypothetical protein OG239_06835 [Streptomyces sp. NBC_00868]